MHSERSTSWHASSAVQGWVIQKAHDSGKDWWKVSDGRPIRIREDHCLELRYAVHAEKCLEILRTCNSNLIFSPACGHTKHWRSLATSWSFLVWRRTLRCLCSICFWKSCVWRELDDLIFSGQWIFWQGRPQSGVKLATKDCLDCLFYIHATTYNRQCCHVGNSTQHCP